MSTSPRATFSRSLAISLGLILVILLLGRALLAVVDLPAPVAEMLGSDRPSVVRLSPPDSGSEVTQRVRLGRSGSSTAPEAGDQRTATRRSATSKRTRTARKASPKTRSRVSRGTRGVGTSNGGSGLPSTGTTTPAPSTGTTTPPATGGGTAGASTSPSRSLTRKMTLQVADVSTGAGSYASGARMRLTLADAETGGAPATASAGLPPTVDLQLGLSRSDVVALAASAPIDGPVALSARVDVVDDAGTGTAPEMRVRMQLVPVGTAVSEPSVGATGDDGGLSNTVEVVVPVDASRLFSRDRGVEGGPSTATSAAAPESEVRLPLATAPAGEPAPAAPEPVTDGAELAVPTDATTASNSTPATVQVAVQLETVTPPTPPADATPEPTATPSPTPEPTATPSPPEPTATPSPTPEPTATPSPTPEPTAAATAPSSAEATPGTAASATTASAASVTTASAAATPAATEAAAATATPAPEATPAATATPTPAG